jgi:hypothetical protein
VRTIALHPSDPDWVAVGIELRMRSLDGGASWIDHNPQGEQRRPRAAHHPLAPGGVYEAAGQGIARSEDRGETWSECGGELGRHYAWAQAVDCADSGFWCVAVTRSAFAAHGERDGQALGCCVPAAVVRLRSTPGATLPRFAECPMRWPLSPSNRTVCWSALRGGSLLLTDDAGES